MPISEENNINTLPAQAGSTVQPTESPSSPTGEPVSFFRLVERNINRLGEIFGIIAICFLIFMMVFTVTDVCLRYFFNKPITGSYEITEFLMVTVGFLAIAWCAVKGTHIKVDLVVGRWSVRAQAITDIVNALLVIGLSVLIITQSFWEGWIAMESGSITTILKIVHYPFYWLISLGYLVLLLVMITILVNSVRKAVKG